MRLVKIPYSDVKRDLEAVEAQGSSSASTKNFNTSFHSAHEAPDLEVPSEAPYSFKRWLPLILRSRNLTSSAGVQTVSLTRPQARLLFRACEGSILTGTLNRMYADDLQDEIVPLLSTQLAFPPEGLFLRLDACSPKDGVQNPPGKASLHTVEEVILRIVTSTRARNALFHTLEDTKQVAVEMYFLPFNPQMRSEREYRVFCRPGDARMTGISQYRWHKPWLLATDTEGQPKSGREMEGVAGIVTTGATHLHRQILGELQRDDENELLLKQGFSFDVFYDEDKGQCELVELNTFGVRSACGSCLFQWVKDRHILYGQEDIEFRVTLQTR
ncbi:hypothetical protein QBC46DRAFT_394556 [Diplogelasinospora grovesii]|uniref:Cell division cycle protein 123 n=1 Tax=Diplogelasinospora grovesii TaxID=303347 RepID=A0AAN6N006_9PEZI|nr:hypothetical protein QBC46DRAFT_394556 [Diplogelasinospora grovesii]